MKKTHEKANAVYDAAAKSAKAAARAKYKAVLAAYDDYNAAAAQLDAAGSAKLEAYLDK